jgi:hypothetical protein
MPSDQSTFSKKHRKTPLWRVTFCSDPAQEMEPNSVEMNTPSASSTSPNDDSSKVETADASSSRTIFQLSVLEMNEPSSLSVTQELAQAIFNSLSRDDYADFASEVVRLLKESESSTSEKQETEDTRIAIAADALTSLSNSAVGNRGSSSGGESGAKVNSDTGDIKSTNGDGTVDVSCHHCTT